MMLLDIIMTLVAFFISVFHGFLDDYRHGDSSCTTIVILKLIAIVVFAIRMVMSFVTIDYEDDTFYLYITDIIQK
jgi:UDP-N-acetylmuramyl pentapeptide phosphotransferase/UDP-N-acetylglucosamine-1-phosphate transferase